MSVTQVLINHAFKLAGAIGAPVLTDISLQWLFKKASVTANKDMVSTLAGAVVLAGISCKLPRPMQFLACAIYLVYKTSQILKAQVIVPKNSLPFPEVLDLLRVWNKLSMQLGASPSIDLDQCARNETHARQKAEAFSAWAECNRERLQGITELDLSRTRLTTLPRKLCEILPHLQKLDVSGNRLTALPSEIGQLSSLQLLYVSGNQLPTLPAEIGRLSSLKQLDVSFNRLTALPTEIGQLSSLQRLNVSRNGLTALPSEIGRLSSLQGLDVSGNQLPTLPAEIGRLSSLQGLDVSDNRLTALPTEIGQLSSLQQLNVSHNRLTALPSEIGRLSSLQWLNVSSNQLPTLPSEIGRLSSLQGLYVSHNGLTALPTEIGQLSSLQRLNVSHNRLTALPNSLANLYATYTCYAENNLFSPETITIIAFQNAIAAVRRDNPSRGPSFSASLPEEPPVAASSILENLITAWRTEFTATFPHLPLTSPDYTLLCAHQNKGQLQIFLQKLKTTQDYQNGESSRQHVILQTQRMLDRGANHTAFREKLFMILEDANTSCSDRVSLAFTNIEIQWRLSQGEMSDVELARLLIGLRRLDLLDIQARKRITDLRLGDHIEIFLHYRVKLKDALRLPISTEGMSYPQMAASITPKILEEDCKAVLAQTTSEQDIVSILIQYDTWNERMKTVHSEQIKTIITTFEKKMTAIEVDTSLPEQKKIDQMKDLVPERETQVKALIADLTRAFVKEHHQLGR